MSTVPYVGAILHRYKYFGGCGAVMVTNIEYGIMELASFDGEHLDHSKVVIAEGVWHWPAECTVVIPEKTKP